MGRGAIVYGLVLWMGWCWIGCSFGPDERHLRYPGPIRSTDFARGRTRYEVVCSPCHGNHERRRGPLLLSQHWTPPRIRQRVREGTALMPAIPMHRITDADLETLLAYFVTIGVAEPEVVEEAPPARVDEIDPIESHAIETASEDVADDVPEEDVAPAEDVVLAEDVVPADDVVPAEDLPHDDAEVLGSPYALP